MSSPVEILSSIQEKINYWINFDSTHISIKFLPSMSNIVYLVQILPEHRDRIHEGQPYRVLYREFATGLLDSLISRKVENEIFKFLAEKGLGPQLLYVDSQIRIEEFINGEPLTPQEMIDPKYQFILMRDLTKYNTLKPENISRESPFDVFIYSMKLHELIEKKKTYTNFTDSELEKIKTITERFNKEFFTELRGKINMPKEDLVVSHNDLLNGNIMKISENEFMLIDYEYMSYNYPGFDIGNYCVESMFDYSYQGSPHFKIIKENLPSGETLTKLYRLYILFFENRKNNGEKLGITSFDDNENIDAEWSKNSEKYDSLLNKYLSIHKYNMVISHLYWLLWGIVVSKNPKIEFDYIEFSWQRFQHIHELLGMNL